MEIATISVGGTIAIGVIYAIIKLISVLRNGIASSLKDISVSMATQTVQSSIQTELLRDIKSISIESRNISKETDKAVKGAIKHSDELS